MCYIPKDHYMTSHGLSVEGLAEKDRNFITVLKTQSLGHITLCNKLMPSSAALSLTTHSIFFFKYNTDMVIVIKLLL